MADDDSRELICGRNAVLAFLKPLEGGSSSSARINKIFLSSSHNPDRRLDEIKKLAKDNNVLVVRCENSRLDQLVGPSQAHQGVVAQLSPISYWELDDFLKFWRKKLQGEPFPDGFMVAVLDGISDPHNLGAIVRVAECAGVKALLIPERRSAQVTATVAKTSSGAIALIPIVRIQNIVRALEDLKTLGFWIAGLDVEGSEVYHQLDLVRPLAVVVGGEGKGISRLVREHCDMLLRIPMFGKTESLNASVAAGIIFFEVARQVNVSQRKS